MAATTPRLAVHPAPVSLKELSVIAIGQEIWRCEVDKYRTSDTLRELCPSSECISLNTKLPDLPRAIYIIIKEYTQRFGLSLEKWLKKHHIEIFKICYLHQNDILAAFNDFVCDFDGTIHYVKTAKRMMRCDLLSEAVKFEIACKYCFEDDIKQMWPFVCKRVHGTCFSENPQLYYWLCCLRNELGKIPNPDNILIDEVMLNACMDKYYNRSSLEYFWNRIPSKKRRLIAINRHSKQDKRFFVRFILPNLNDQQLEEFVKQDGGSLMHNWLIFCHCSEEVILSYWMYIRNVLNESAFTNLVITMLRSIASNCRKENVSTGCCEIWNFAPHNLKRSAIRDILSNVRLFADLKVGPTHGKDSTTEIMKFLFTILSYATFEERSSFWHNCWDHLIAGIRGKDLQRMMKLCFKDDYEITRFKENVMLKSGNVRLLCVSLLRCAFFDQVNNLVGFCYPEIHITRNFKQQLLESAFLNDDSEIDIHIFRKVKQFSEFIDDAYNNAHLSTNFKNQLISSPAVQRLIVCDGGLVIPHRVGFQHFMNFFDTLVPTEQTLRLMKRRIIDHSEKYFADKCYLLSNSFLLWCLGSDDEVAVFKLRCHIINQTDKVIVKKK